MTFDAARKILVVDDEDSIRELCSQILSLEGYSVETAINGEDALIKIEDSSYDLIISDMEMPVLNGVSLYLHVEREHPYLKNRFIFMSGNMEMEKKAREVLSRAGGRVLHKPFKPNELLNHARILVSVPIEKYLNQTGLNRRKEERFARAADCQISVEESYAFSSFTAQVQDISERGIKVRYSGVPLLNKGSKVSVNIKDIKMRRTAEIAWIRDLKWFSLCGLKLIEPLPASAVMTSAAAP